MKSKKILFFYQLSQDLDVLLPAMKHSILLNYEVKILVTEGLLKASPRMGVLRNFGAEVNEIPKKCNWLDLMNAIRGSSIVVTATDTNVGSHRIANRLVKLANFFFKKTITSQHGYENLGLTYSDREYPIWKIRFASKFILTWSDELHAEIPNRTKKKCVVSGIPKDYDIQGSCGDLLEQNYIAVFENLHWGRFSERYKESFMLMLKTLSTTFPDTKILVKPHHAGKWLTSRYKGPLPQYENVLILDPASSSWEPYTAPAVISHARAVISTPSSVCVDAHFQRKPIAVLQFDLNLTNYNFAQKCQTIEDVVNFIKKPSIIESSTPILSHANFLKSFEEVLRK